METERKWLRLWVDGPTGISLAAHSGPPLPRDYGASRIDHIAKSMTGNSLCQGHKWAVNEGTALVMGEPRKSQRHGKSQQR